MPFAADFVWGVATASYQIEGTPARVGGGESVWDMFCRRPGAIWQGTSGAVACDHFNRYRDDVAIMQALGIQGYRFSLAWPRIMPQGTGAVSADGIGFYDRLIDALLEANITPYVTLFHWDYPYDLYCRGGWLNPDSPQWFADYTRVVVDALSDRVRHWMTLNEPQCFIGLGHQVGVHAPGDKLAWREVLRAGHHALLAHGRAVQTIRAYAKTPAQIGFAPVGAVSIPATESEADIQAAYQHMFSLPERNTWTNAWWIDPVFLGRYPEDGLRIFGDDAPTIGSDDMTIISQPLDFFGANIYNGHPVRLNEHGNPEPVPHPIETPRNMYHWPVTPEALYWGARFFHERYGKPIIITENGIANMDWVALDGKVHDPQRIDFLTRYLLQLERAADEGIPIQGYFQWSFMDNFEWQEGFKQRFGLVYVNYETQERLPKDSARWYKQLIASNGEILRAGLPVSSIK
jgi:beta-glucosidase